MLNNEHIRKMRSFHLFKLIISFDTFPIMIHSVKYL